MPAGSREQCPSDGELAAFVEHALAGPTRVQVEAHLDHCATCRAAVGHVVGVVDDLQRRLREQPLERQIDLAVEHREGTGQPGGCDTERGNHQLPRRVV